VFLLKLLQSLISTLNSEGTPRQIAAGIALGGVLGLTPLVNVHNLLVFAAAGAYGAWVEGVTTEPAVYGGPLRFAAQRTAAATGPRQLRVAGLLHITAPGVRWVRTTDDTAAAASASLGSKAWGEALVWRAVSSVRDLDLQIRFSGRPAAPRLDVTCNVGSGVSSALQREVGAEVAKVQAKARARVDSLVGQQVAAARAKVTAIQERPPDPPWRAAAAAGRADATGESPPEPRAGGARPSPAEHSAPPAVEVAISRQPAAASGEP
jgi:hypothetical protein